MLGVSLPWGRFVSLCIYHLLPSKNANNNHTSTKYQNKSTQKIIYATNISSLRKVHALCELSFRSIFFIFFVFVWFSFVNFSFLLLLKSFHKKKETKTPPVRLKLKLFVVFHLHFKSNLDKCLNFTCVVKRIENWKTNPPAPYWDRPFVLGFISVFIKYAKCFNSTT